jgi:hypothetical protein
VVRRGGWFGHAGPTLVHRAIRSKVPEWEGWSDVGLAGQLTGGWELGGPVLLRVSVSLIGGSGRVVPWAGIAGGLRW